jgi:hypothetical protein
MVRAGLGDDSGTKADWRIRAQLCDPQTRMKSGRRYNVSHGLTTGTRVLW